MASRSKACLVSATLFLGFLSGPVAAEDPKDPTDPNGTDETVALTGTGGKLPWETFDERLKSSHSVKALGSDLFGDSVSLQNGALSFEVTDVSIPGNSHLPVALTRRYEVINHKDHDGADGMLGDWNLAIPSISGSFAPDWISSGANPGNRCSDQLPPPTPASNVNLNEFWRGLTVEIPGVGGGELLKYDPVTNPLTPVPADGMTYKWVTNDHIRIYCLPDIPADNKTGEGFVAVTPDGMTYTFDHMAQYFEPVIESIFFTHPTETFTTFHDRRKNVLYVTNIKDRFGNEVDFTYSNLEDQPGRLTRIEADDGRFLQLTYTNDRISSVSDGARTWSYSYVTTPDGRQSLDKVTLPDQVTQWDINFVALTDAEIEAKEWGESDRTCRFLDTPWNIEAQFAGSVVHPSGATGNFTLAIREHGRSNVPLGCGHVSDQNDPTDDINTYAISAYSLTLVEKSITGPGLSGLTWDYTYQPNVNVHMYPGTTLAYPVCDWDTQPCSSPPCTSGWCGASKTTVDGPGNEWTRYEFGNSFRYNEGKLLKVERGSGASAVLETTVHAYDMSLVDQGYPSSYGESMQANYDGNRSTFHRPLLSTSVTKQAETFTWEVLDGCLQGVCANVFAHPEKVMRYSTLGFGRTELTAYLNDLDDWVIGQVETLTCSSAVPNNQGCNNTVVSHTGFDSLARPTTRSAFGKLQYTLGYHPAGMLHTYTDGRGGTTYLTSWYRGVPQQIDHPNTASGTGIETASVAPDGSITSVTNEVGAKTCYAYDDLGRLETITYPSESQSGVCATTSWNPTNISYAFGTSQYVSGGAHWQQTTQTGDSVKRNYFDAFWRPAVVHEHRSPSGDSRFMAFSYDHAGRTTFAAYPGASWPLPAGQGIDTVYDSLGRVTSVTQDAEAIHGGAVSTTMNYLAGFLTRVTNPRGFSTTTGYMAFDQPGTDWPVAMTHPEGVYTDIERDVYGKPLSITRGDGVTTALTRNYVYNGYQELCKRIEPETGVSVSTYDAAGNLDWSASGQLALNDTDCLDLSTVSNADRVNRLYDARNRLTDLAFSDGNGSQEWEYYDDGLPATVTTWNNEGLSWVVNDYTYNQRRLLTGESQYQPDSGNAWSISYNYDPRGYLASHGYPDGTTVAYSPDHFGRATKAGAFATGATYHASGGLAGFVYGNGVVHSMTPNARQMPEASRDHLPGATNDIHHDVLGYDENGNVELIGDQRAGHPGDRAMAYDDLDRLLSTVWTSRTGFAAEYAYDALDNLTRVKAPYHDRDHYYCYSDGTNRLTNVSDQACAGSGASVIALGYDDQGNLASKDGSGFMLDFDFDHGNRLRDSAGKETYRYDAHGRRIQATDTAGGDIFSVYGQDGVLRYQVDERRGEATSFFYLAGSLVARARAPLAAAAPALSAGTVNTTTGDYVLSWTATGGSYLLSESDDGGQSWGQVADTTLTSWSADDKPNGTYQYRVQGCDPVCSGHSNVVDVTVVRKPTQQPTITQPTYASTELYTFTVAWTSVQYATDYQLQQRYEGGTWSTIHNGTATSKSVTVAQDGTYEYRAFGCNSGSPAECGPYSSIKLVEVGPVTPEPPDTPVLTVPADDEDGDYNVTWTSVTGATAYNLQERAVGTSTWGIAYDGGTALAHAAVDHAGGTFEYRIQACAAPTICSPWSAPKAIALLPPTGAPTLMAPATSASGDYTITGTLVTNASQYRLEERTNGGATWAWIDTEMWGLTHSLVDKPAGNYEYKAKACNAFGCGPYSAVKLVEVGPPTEAPVLAVPVIGSPGNYTLSWTTVDRADSYKLEESINNGAWSVTTLTGTSKSYGSKPPGSYRYRVQGWRGSGGPYSVIRSVTVVPSTPVLTVPNDDEDGDYNVTWTSVTGATEYNLQERAVGTSTWGVAYDGGTALVHAAVDHAGGTFEYRVQACATPTVCSPWSATKAIALLPPSGAPTLTAPATSSSGDYTITGALVTNASQYRLEERTNGGATWAWIDTEMWGLTHALVDKPAGNYEYKAKACNAFGCGPYSAVKLVEVGPPTAAPTLTAPASSSTGDYTVSWTTVPRGDTYDLEQSLDNAAWTDQTHSGTSKIYNDQPSGSYRYRVRGCRGTCGPYSAIGTVVVSQPPANPPPTPGNLVVDYLGASSCLANWDQSTGADRYELARNNVEIYDGPDTTYWYKNACNATYKVRACNGAGCSVWSAGVWPTPPNLINSGGDE